MRLFVSLLALLTACAQKGSTDMAAGARVLDSLYISGAGSAAASGSVSFFGVGTLVPAVVYSDDALTQPQTQPIVLDASGKTPLPVYSATPLRAIIKAASGATLQDIARIDGDRAELVGVSNAAWSATDLNSVLTAIQSSLGGTDAQFMDAGVGAVARTIRSKFSGIQVSVKDYGAVGNGVADDTVAIQAAINRVTALGGGIVFFDKGTYIISSTLNFTANSNVGFAGASQFVSVIKNNNPAGSALTIAGPGGSYVFSDIQFTHSSTSSAPAISSASSVLLVFTRTYVFNHTGGIAGQPGVFILNSNFVSAGAGTAVAASGTAIGATFQSVTGTGLSVLGGMTLIGGKAAAGSIGVDIGVSSFLLASGFDASACTTGLRTDPTATIIRTPACNMGTVNDQRTGIPVAYSFNANGNFTPLPGQTDAVRAVGTAGGITITVNNITATGFTSPWTLICSNTSGGVVTWTFGANYVLSAAVNPASGNRVNLTLTYDPISGKVYEVGRAATAN